MRFDSVALAQMAESVRHRCGSPGLAVAVVDLSGEDFLFGSGKADVDEGIECGVHTIFPIASVTKTYTSALVLALHHEGRLSLDAAPDGFPSGSRCGSAHDVRQPTLRDALSHRSGIAGCEELWFNTPWNRQEILARLALAAPLSPPGTRFAYSNLMVVQAGEAAARAAGMPYEQALRTKILLPSGDSESGFEWGNTGRCARPYERTAAGRLLRLPPADTQRAAPALGLKSSAARLAGWARFLLSGGNSALPRRVIAQAWTPHITIRPEEEPRIRGFFGLTRKLEYGLGWFLGEYCGSRTVSHTGTLPGYRCHLSLVPDEGIGVAALANLNRTLAPEVFVYGVLDMLTGRSTVDWFDHFELVREERERWQRESERAELSEASASDPADPAEWPGVYEDEVLGPLTVWCEGGVLWIRWANYTSRLERRGNGWHSLMDLDCPLMGEEQSIRFPGSAGGGLRACFLGREFRKISELGRDQESEAVFACARGT